MPSEVKYRTVNQLAECGKYPFSLGQLRALLMSRDKNGLNQATIRIGKRIYIRSDWFEKWLESKGESRYLET